MNLQVLHLKRSCTQVIPLDLSPKDYTESALKLFSVLDDRHHSCNCHILSVMNATSYTNFCYWLIPCAPDSHWHPDCVCAPSAHAPARPQSTTAPPACLLARSHPTPAHPRPRTQRHAPPVRTRACADPFAPFPKPYTLYLKPATLHLKPALNSN